MPVVGPSVIFSAQPKLGDVSEFLDVGNSHPYPGGRPQSATLDSELQRQRVISGDKPVWITETGYHNALAVEGGHRPTSEAAEAVYLPRLFLTTFAAGVPRTFDYELVDSFDRGDADAESEFGLLRYDFTPRPAYAALKQLLGLLGSVQDGADPEQPAEPFEPQPLALAVETPAETARSLLLQRHDGRYVLAVWNEVKVWDQDAVEPIDVKPVSSVLRLGVKSTVTEHRLGEADPVEVGQTRLHRFELRPAVTLFEIDPIR